MPSNDLTCQELVELITGYIEAALPARERERVESHLAGCTGCRNYLDQMRRTVGALGTLPADSLPEPVRDELLTLFRGWKRGAGGGE